jgi:hypothetical protein
LTPTPPQQGEQSEQQPDGGGRRYQTEAAIAGLIATGIAQAVENFSRHALAVAHFFAFWAVTAIEIARAFDLFRGSNDKSLFVAGDNFFPGPDIFFIEDIGNVHRRIEAEAIDTFKSVTTLPTAALATVRATLFGEAIGNAGFDTEAILALQRQATAPAAPIAAIVTTLFAGAIRRAGVGVEAKAIGGAVPAVGARATKGATAIIPALLAQT